MEKKIDCAYRQFFQKENGEEEHENYPIHIITPRQILKAGIKESITEEDMEKTSQLFEDLKIKDEPIKSH